MIGSTTSARTTIESPRSPEPSRQQSRVSYYPLGHIEFSSEINRSRRRSQTSSELRGRRQQRSLLQAAHRRRYQRFEPAPLPAVSEERSQASGRNTVGTLTYGLLPEPEERRQQKFVKALRTSTDRIGWCVRRAGTSPCTVEARRREAKSFDVEKSLQPPRICRSTRPGGALRQGQPSPLKHARIGTFSRTW
jgi:hypothetical protein